jgi:hypothetical protein
MALLVFIHFTLITGWRAKLGLESLKNLLHPT